MYYTREYIIWFPFYLLWRPLTRYRLGLSRYISRLIEKPSCRYVVEDKSLILL